MTPACSTASHSMDTYSGSVYRVINIDLMGSGIFNSLYAVHTVVLNLRAGVYTVRIYEYAEGSHFLSCFYAERILMAASMSMSNDVVFGIGIGAMVVEFNGRNFGWF